MYTVNGWPKEVFLPDPPSIPSNIPGDSRGDGQSPHLYAASPRAQRSLAANSSHLKCVKTNYSRTLVATLSANSVYIWSGGPNRFLLAQYSRSKDGSAAVVGQEGPFRCLQWRRDSSVLAVATHVGYVYILKVEQLQNMRSAAADFTASSGGLYVPTGDSKVLKLQTFEGANPDDMDLPAGPTVTPPVSTWNLSHTQSPLALKLQSKVHIMYGEITTMTCNQRHLLVGTKAGYLISLLWSTGEIFQAVSVESMLSDLRQLRRPSRVPQYSTPLDPNKKGMGSPRGAEPDDDDGTVKVDSPGDIGVLDIEYQFRLKRYAIIFTNGLVGVLHTGSGKSASRLGTGDLNRLAAELDTSFHGDIRDGNGTASRNSAGGSSNYLASFEGVLFRLPSACCLSINAKYQSVAVGCANGTVHIYDLTTTRVNLLHIFEVATERGGISALEWSPDEEVLAIGYEHRGVSVIQTDTQVRCLHTIPSSVSTSGTRARRQNSTTDQVTDSELLKDGVVSLAWTAEGYSLICVPFLPMATSFFGSGRSHSPHTGPLHTPGTSSTPTSGLRHSSSTLELGSLSRQLTGSFIEFPFYKSVLARNGNECIANSVILQGAEDLLVMTQVHAEAWDRVPYPKSYLYDHFPIRFVAVSPNNQYVTVAGRRGIAVYNRSTDKWKLFGSRQQELTICAQSLGYALTHTKLCPIVIGNWNPVADVFELLIMSKSHLDTSAVYYRKQLRARPILLSSYKDTLLVYDTEFDLEFYKITVKDAPNAPNQSVGGSWLNPTPIRKANETVELQVQSLRVVSLVTSPAHPISLRLLPPMKAIDDDGSEEEVDNCVILRPNGLLGMLHVSSDRVKESCLCVNIRHFWIESCSPNRIHVLVYGTAGIEMVSVSLSSGMRTANSSPVTVHPEGGAESFIKQVIKDMEVNVHEHDWYPLGILSESGVVVLGSQGARSERFINIPCYKVQQRVYPYVHDLLVQYLREGDFDYALEVAQQISNQSHFSQILEWLLHTVLQIVFYGTDEIVTSSNTPELGALSSGSAGRRLEPMEADGSDSDMVTAKKRSRAAHESLTNGLHDVYPYTLLNDTVSLMHHFPQNFHEVVVQCARKTEIGMFKCLFAAVGEPKKLFAICVETERYQLAAGYLRILQETDGLHDSVFCAHSLYVALLKKSNHQLRSLKRDVGRYIRLCERELGVILSLSVLAAHENEDPDIDDYDTTTTLDTSLKEFHVQVSSSNPLVEEPGSSSWAGHLDDEEGLPSPSPAPSGGATRSWNATPTQRGTPVATTAVDTPPAGNCVLS